VSGFSSSGGSIEDDPRNQLAFCVPEWADAVAPKVVVVENVVGLQDLHGPTHSALVDVLADAGDGYTVATVRLDAADYNVPQARERVFLVAVREDCPTPDQWEPPVVTAPAPTRTLTGTSLPEYDTAGDALDELPAPIASAPPADDPVHETIEAVQPGAGEWGRHRVDPHTVAGHRRSAGRSSRCRRTTSHLITPRRRERSTPSGRSGTAGVGQRIGGCTPTNRRRR